MSASGEIDSTQSSIRTTVRGFKMINRLATFALVTTLITGSFFLTGRPAEALMMSPYQVDLSAKPGQSAITTFRIVNDSNIPITIRGYAHDIIYDAKKNKESFVPPRSKDSVALRTRFDPPVFKLGALQGKSVKVSVKMPENVKEGQYVMVFFETVADQDKAKDKKKKAITAKMVFSTRLGARYMVSVDGVSTYQGKIDQIKIQPPTATKPLGVGIRVANTGNTHFWAQGYVNIVNEGGEFVGQMALERQVIYPKRKGVFISRWSGDLDPGKYSALITLTYANQKSITVERPFTVN